MANLEYRLEAHVAAANAAIAELKASSGDPATIRRLYQHLGHAMDFAQAAGEAGLALREASLQELVDLLDEVRILSFRYTR